MLALYAEIPRTMTCFRAPSSKLFWSIGTRVPSLLVDPSGSCSSELHTSSASSLAFTSRRRLTVTHPMIATLHRLFASNVFEVKYLCKLDCICSRQSTKR